jgi:hypothetical protein
VTWGRSKRFTQAYIAFYIRPKGYRIGVPINAEFIDLTSVADRTGTKIEDYGYLGGDSEKLVRSDFATCRAARP